MVGPSAAVRRAAERGVLPLGDNVLILSILDTRLKYGVLERIPYRIVPLFLIRTADSHGAGGDVVREMLCTASCRHSLAQSSILRAHQNQNFAAASLFGG